MNDIGDNQECEKSIVELRALLASYEERLSRTADRTPESHAARVHIPEPLFLINDLAVDLRSSALENSSVVDAPGIIDCFKPDEPEPFAYVYKVTNGVFRVHPRQGRLSAAVMGPFSGPAPSGVVATAQTTHGSAPPVRFHVSTWRGEIDNSTVTARLDGPGARFLTVPPRHPGFLISTDETGIRSACRVDARLGPGASDHRRSPRRDRLCLGGVFRRRPGLPDGLRLGGSPAVVGVNDRKCSFRNIMLQRSGRAGSIRVSISICCSPGASRSAIRI